MIKKTLILGIALLFVTILYFQLHNEKINNNIEDKIIEKNNIYKNLCRRSKKNIRQ